METPTTPEPEVTLTSATTPLGAQTPQMHPMLPKVVGGFIVVIILGVYLVWANSTGTWPYARQTLAGPGEHCGGNMSTALGCTAGYHCAPDPASHLPYGDVGGLCIKDGTTPAPSQGFNYENESYGFSINLPDTWQGYTATAGTWQGVVYSANGNQTGTDQGPQITINYPGASDANPHEAMPVMVFTIAQWNLVSAGDSNPAKPFMSVGAAPIGPSELARNSKYVFALPARYNYDYKPGYEEVDTLVHKLKAFEVGQ